VYPKSLHPASVGSPAFGISSGNLALLAVIVAALALVGAITIRITRLQP
jgi:hypothetical protein